MFPVFLSDMSDNDVEGSLVTIITTPHHYGALKPDATFMETSTIRLSTHFRDERPTSSHHCNGFPWFFFAERLVTGLVTGDSKYSKRGWLKPPVDRKRYNDERTVRNDRGRCGREILCSLIDDYVTSKTEVPNFLLSLPRLLLMG
ncbi:hypothetical protein HZH66_007227 [Vespula vulgaris]|uniref:Uncharacterized protein n=1 Tax=Vespula vulgaris TaxID=7454 RepID=A0A834N5C8_VESVU|nr:hypothetical protein HZH66_007227 [Vespula vulgaris]